MCYSNKIQIDMFGYQRVRWWGDERCSCNSEAWETFSFIGNESTTFMMLVYIFFLSKWCFSSWVRCSFILYVAIITDLNREENIFVIRISLVMCKSCWSTQLTSVDIDINKKNKLLWKLLLFSFAAFGLSPFCLGNKST